MVTSSIGINGFFYVKNEFFVASAIWTRYVSNLTLTLDRTNAPIINWWLNATYTISVTSQHVLSLYSTFLVCFIYYHIWLRFVGILKHLAPDVYLGQYKVRHTIPITEYCTSHYDDVIHCHHWFLLCIKWIVRSFCNCNAICIKFDINVDSNECTIYQLMIERYVHNFSDVTARS